MLEMVSVDDRLSLTTSKFGDQFDKSHQYNDSATEIVKLSPSEGHQHNVVTSIDSKFTKETCLRCHA